MASHWVVMTKTQFRLGALLILAAILLHNLTSPNRYKLVSAQGGLTAGYLVDGVTGEAIYLLEELTTKVR